MHSLVSNIVESFLAKLAAKWPLVGVNVHMRLQIASLSKPLPADFTLETLVLILHMIVLIMSLKKKVFC